MDCILLLAGDMVVEDLYEVREGMGTVLYTVVKFVISTQEYRLGKLYNRETELLGVD